MRITYLMRILNLKYLKNDLAQSQETFAKLFIGIINLFLLRLTVGDSYLNKILIKN